MRIAILVTLLASTLTLSAQEEVFLGAKLTSEGFFGIGTASPTARLHVNGDSIVTGMLMGSGYHGNFGKAALLNGFGYSGAAAQFVFQYDDIDFQPGDPRAIQITNVNTNTFKTFIIDHPTDASRYLVHASLEGPEGAVYYRGTARLTAGRAVIELPAYFESLTEKEGRTILLTNIDGFEPLAVRKIDGQKVRGGAFVVEARDTQSEQEFDWEVKAVRADGPPLRVEPLRSELRVGGFGPYTYRLP